MNQLNQLVCLSEEISSFIKSLNDEVSKIEDLYVKNKRIDYLKKENDELEELIENYITELNDLENANGSNMDMTEVEIEETNTGDNNDLLQLKAETCVAKQESSNIKKDNKITNKQENKKKGGSVNKSAAGDTLQIDIGRLDLKVGRIIEIKKHDDADTLYVETVDIGAAQPLTVVSGLVKHIPIEEMKNKLVIVLCNLKPVKMRGVTSEAMVMCASTPDLVEVLIPPPTSKPGDAITVPGFPPPSGGVESVLNPKKKVFETLAPELMTDSQCFATFRGVRWEVAEGFVKSASLSRVNIK